MARCFARHGEFEIEPPLTPAEATVVHEAIGDVDFPAIATWSLDDEGTTISLCSDGDELNCDDVDAIVPILNDLRKAGHTITGEAELEGYKDCGDYTIGFSKRAGEFVKGLDREDEAAFERGQHLAAMQQSLTAYRDERRKPGGFLTAVLENDLQAACEKADHLNRLNLFDLLAWCTTELPTSCWGSRERVNAWLGKETS